MEQEQIDASINKTEKKEQKKSEKDRNGIIGGLVFGAIAVFATYQIYDKFFEFLVGKILVYILGCFVLICFAVSISSFFDFKESKKIEKLDEDARCILRSRADSDVFQSGRYAEHNGRPETLKNVT